MAIITKLKKEDFEKVLSKYDVGQYQSHKHVGWALQNTIYIIKTTKETVVLKIVEDSDISFIYFQLDTLEYVSKYKIPVAKVLFTKYGKDVINFQGKNMYLQKFLKGNAPKKFTNSLIKDIAQKLGFLDKTLLKLPLHGKFVWTFDHEFKKKKISVTLPFSEYKNKESILVANLKKLNRRKLRRSVIHGDFHDVNLLVRGNKLTGILDWDDCHEDYLVYELTVFIMSSFITPKGVSLDKIRFFLKEYQKQIKLNVEEKKALYYFIQERFLGVILWYSKRTKSHSDILKKIKNAQKKIIRSYLNFCNVDLETFLKLT